MQSRWRQQEIQERIEQNRREKLPHFCTDCRLQICVAESAHNKQEIGDHFCAYIREHDISVEPSKCERWCEVDLRRQRDRTLFCKLQTTFNERCEMQMNDFIDERKTLFCGDPNDNDKRSADRKAP